MLEYAWVSERSRNAVIFDVDILIFAIFKPSFLPVYTHCDTDMNPKDFVAPWDAYELSKFVREQKADMLIVP